MLIAGTGASPALVKLASHTPGVELLGDVRDAEALYRRSRCFVDVGIGGSGTRVKLLNTFARGLPAVATRDAAEGLDVTPGVHLLLADSPRTAVPSIVRLLTDDETWRTLSTSGRELVRARYVPEVAFRALDEALGDP